MKRVHKNNRAYALKKHKPLKGDQKLVKALDFSVSAYQILLVIFVC